MEIVWLSDRGRPGSLGEGLRLAEKEQARADREQAKAEESRKNEENVKRLAEEERRIHFEAQVEVHESRAKLGIHDGLDF